MFLCGRQCYGYNVFRVGPPQRLLPLLPCYKIAMHLRHNWYLWIGLWIKHDVTLLVESKVAEDMCSGIDRAVATCRANAWVCTSSSEMKNPIHRPTAGRCLSQMKGFGCHVKDRHP